MSAISAARLRRARLGYAVGLAVQRLGDCALLIGLVQLGLQQLGDCELHVAANREPSSARLGARLRPRLRPRPRLRSRLY